MNDGGAETSTKSIMERYMQEPLRRFMGWLAKKGFIKGKNAAKSYKENHLTKAVELCKKDGSTKELIHSEYELTQDEMMKIAARQKEMEFHFILKIANILINIIQKMKFIRWQSLMKRF